MLAMVALSWVTTPRALREENGFGFAPIVEVAVLFAGIFATMIPALAILNVHGAALGLTEPWQFFWATGLLSSFLDNAPTYLTFDVGRERRSSGPTPRTSRSSSPTDQGPRVLAAVSAGAVLMGANTYIGNGPNFMVKAIAELAGVPMPGFFRYMLWSGMVLLPLFAVVTWVFFT